MSAGRVLISLTVVIVIVVLGGGGYYLYTVRYASATASKAPVKPAYVSMAPFTVHIPSKQKKDYEQLGAFVQIGFELETTNPDAIEQYKTLKPAVRGRVLSVLLQLNRSILNDKKARSTMKSHVLAVVNQTLAGEGDKASTSTEDPNKPSFQKIYLTRFLSQPG